MARAIDILFNLRDGISQALENMRNGMDRFGRSARDIDGQLAALQHRQDALRNSQAQLRTSMDAARNSVAEARKAYRQMNDEASRTNLQRAYQEYERLSAQLRGFQRESRETEREMNNLRAARSRLENQAGGGMLSALAQAGFVRMAGDSLTQGAKLFANSAWGSEVGSVVSGALSGATAGAAMGSMLGPGGTAIGTAAGTVIGTLNGAIQVGQKRDESFKGVVQDQYNGIMQQREQDLQAGKEIYAGREMDQISFTNLLGGEETAKDYLSWVKKTANSTPFLYSDLTSMSKTLATYGYSPEEMQTALMQIGDTGASLGMSTEDMKMVATGLGRMRSSGKTTLEDINLLQERGIDAIGYLAEAYDKTNAEIYDGISRGLIPGADAARLIAEAMGEANKNAMELQSHTYAGLTSTAEGLQQEQQAAMGEGYDEYIKPYLEAHNEMMNGEFGEQLAEGNRMIGEYHAKLEADRMGALVQAQQAVLNSEEYQKAIAANNGAEAGRLLAEAQAEAEAQFRESEGYQLYLATERKTVEDLRDALAPSWENFGYEMAEEFSKGLASLDLESALDPYTMVDQELRYRTGRGLARSEETPPKRAMGVPYVPYDDFPALLHEGERVLTAAEARNAGNGSSVTVTGNTFVIREEADVDRVAAALVRKICWASAVS